MGERKAFTAPPDDSFAVFLIGMRINTWWRPDLWVPVALSMFRMLRELRAHPELGLLGVLPTGLSNPIVLVQYWRSAEHLMRFASSRELTHLPAWTDYHRRVRDTDAVGVWHETYVVEPGRHETVYVNMPACWLGAAFGVRPADGERTSASGRLTAGAAP